MNLITDNFVLKLVSLVVAGALFFIIKVENSTAVEVDFPVQYHTAEGFMITGSVPGRVHVTLQGVWAGFRSFEMTEMDPVVVKLTARTNPGTLRHVLQSEDFDPPVGMKVVTFRPSEWDVTLDRRVERPVTVSADLPNRPAFGYKIVSVQVEPAEVRVRGPLAKLQVLDFVHTREIDINDREEDLTVEVELRAPPQGMRLLRNRVQVTVDIGEEFVQRTFRGVPVELINAPETVELRVAEVTVVLKGPRRHVDKIDPNSLQATIDVQEELSQGLSRVEKSVELRTELPERTQLVAPIPKVEVVTVRARAGRDR